MTSANIPTEIAHIAAQFVEQGATILLAKLDDTGGYTMAPMRATIVFETAEGKALWTMAGNLVDGRFRDGGWATAPHYRRAVGGDAYLDPARSGHARRRPAWTRRDRHGLERFQRF